MENNSQAPKRRGRPAGSKNKRPRVPATNPSEIIEGDGMGINMGFHQNVLEVPSGYDLIAAVYDYANRHQLRGLGVITTQGTVGPITLHQQNMSSSFLTCNNNYQLLYFTGNFYGSSSSIRPSPFFAHHFAAFVNGEGNLHVGIIHGKLIAETNMALGISFINGTESIKLSLPPPPPPPPPQLRALPSSSLFLDPYGGLHTAASALPLAAARSRTATAGLTELSSGAARSRIATDGLPSGAGRSMTGIAGLTEFSLGAGRFRPALPEFFSGAGRFRPALPEFFSGAGRFRPATDGLLKFSSGAGRFRQATDGLLEFSLGAGSSRTAYGVPAAPSPSPLISCLMTNGNNLSSISGQRSSTGPLGGQTLVKRENNY